MLAGVFWLIPHLAEYESEKKLCKEYTSANWGDEGEIEAMDTDDIKDDNDKDPQDKTRALKIE